MSIDWYDPELYYFLSLLAGFAALLAVVYDFPGGNRAPPDGRACRRRYSNNNHKPAAAAAEMTVDIAMDIATSFAHSQ